jgi:hypothetical protein
MPLFVIPHSADTHRKVSRLSKLEHQMLSCHLRGVQPKPLNSKQAAAVEVLKTERYLRKTTRGLVATKNGAMILDEDARCPVCSLLKCKEHPIRFPMENMRHARSVAADIRKPRAA